MSIGNKSISRKSNLPHETISRVSPSAVSMERFPEPLLPYNFNLEKKRAHSMFIDWKVGLSRITFLFEAKFSEVYY